MEKIITDGMFKNYKLIIEENKMTLKQPKSTFEFDVVSNNEKPTEKDLVDSAINRITEFAVRTIESNQHKDLITIPKGGNKTLEAFNYYTKNFLKRFPTEMFEDEKIKRQMIFSIKSKLYPAVENNENIKELYKNCVNNINKHKIQMQNHESFGCLYM